MPLPSYGPVTVSHRIFTTSFASNPLTVAVTFMPAGPLVGLSTNEVPGGAHAHARDATDAATAIIPRVPSRIRRGTVRFIVLYTPYRVTRSGISRPTQGSSSRAFATLHSEI